MLLLMLLSTLAAITFATSQRAQAHEITPSIIDLTINESHIDIRIITEVEPMILGYDLSVIAQ